MAAPSFSIRPAATTDLESLLGLYRQLNPGDPALDRSRADDLFAAMLALPGMTVFMGFLDETPASTATLIVVPNLTRNGASYALIENVVTHRDHRKRGHAGSR